MSKKVLFAGESWMVYETHVKGFDAFYVSKYDEAVGFVRDALERGGYEFDYLPNHEAITKFPYTKEELSKYDCVILSDIGSNTLLLPPKTFVKSEKTPNRCKAIKEYVEDGGSFLMIGGYMTFTGIDAKGRWGLTPVADILPVKLLEIDDRMESPEGIKPVVVKDHEAIAGIPTDWPEFLGYNKSIPKSDAEVLMEIGGDPFIAVGEYGKGRSAIFSSDCSPHWGPPEFIGWEYYDKVWQSIVGWLTSK